MTARRRTSPPEPTPAPAPAAGYDVWLSRGIPSKQPGVIWLKRPMPDGQWPPEQSLPRDDSWSWWVRAHCGHAGGARQFAFYEERYADLYQHVFRSDPCHFTRCPQRRIRDAG